MKIISSISSTISTIFIQNPISIESATLAHKIIFGLYVLSLIFTLILTVWLWKASNKAQDAVMTDAEVKITAAKAEASKATEGIKKAELKIAEINFLAEEAKENAAKAKYETEKITKENIELRSNLEKSIADAAIEKQKLAKTQIEVSDARRKQVEAEILLEQMKDRMRPRSLSLQQRTRLIEIISNFPKDIVPKSGIHMQVNIGDSEAMSFASQIKSVIENSGLNVYGMENATVPTIPKGLIMLVQNGENAPPYAAAFQRAFTDIGIHVQGIEVPDYGKDEVVLFIGSK